MFSLVKFLHMGTILNFFRWRYLFLRLHLLEYNIGLGTFERWNRARTNQFDIIGFLVNSSIFVPPPHIKQIQLPWTTRWGSFLCLNLYIYLSTVTRCICCHDLHVSLCTWGSYGDRFIVLLRQLKKNWLYRHTGIFCTNFQFYLIRTLYF